jgi:hypothetical protein
LLDILGESADVFVLDGNYGQYFMNSHICWLLLHKHTLAPVDIW